MNDIYQEILNQMHDGVYYTDSQRRITFWNEAAEKITGFTKEEMVGSYCYDNKLQHIDGQGNGLCRGLCPLAKTLKTGEHYETTVYLHHKEGHRVEVLTKTTPIYDEDDNIIGAVELFTDVSNKFNVAKEIAEIQKELYIDPVTNCANKDFALAKIENCINEWKEMNNPFSLCLLSIDNLKEIKKEKGAKLSDKIATMIAKSTNSALKPLNAVCRWAENEFIVIITNMNPNNLENVCERIDLFARNSWLETSDDIEIKLSIGAATISDGENSDMLISKVEKSLKDAKKTNDGSMTIIC